MQKKDQPEGNQHNTQPSNDTNQTLQLILTKLNTLDMRLKKLENTNDKVSKQNHGSKS